MATKVYTFHISYEGLENVIWRNIKLSSTAVLDQVGYTVLAAFDTRANHLFSFTHRDTCYVIPDEEGFTRGTDMATVILADLRLEIGERIRMEYDFGTLHSFWLEVTEIENMAQGKGKRFPYILEGSGQGIIDDMSCAELIELVKQIDEKGHTDKEIYYRERSTPWDYRDFNLERMNKLLKAEIRLIEKSYSPLWNSSSD